MSIFRFATFAALVALMFPLGSSSATTTSSSVPGSLADSPALDLRTVGSRLVVETIEDALRQGGLALFDEGFQLDSSLSWVFGETIEGEVDAVVPLWNRDGHVVFAQPGFVFWTGLEEEERTDGNLGFVYRTRLANTPLGFDAVGGASVFYDYDFKNGHGRAGFGADIQSGFFHGAFNYYHPLTGTQDGREGFVEDALRGMDFRVALEREAMRVGANLGYWRFEGDEEAKGDWRSSYGFDAGIRIVPGVFLEGGWERHDETASFDRRWNAGLAFRFSLPGFEGASYGDGGLSSNLWKLVKREKRILYEERLGIPRVSLSATQRGPVAEPMTAGENETVTVEADLGKPLDEDIMLHVMVVDETSTATLGTDFTYGHRVYELDGATGEQSAPEGDAMPCPEDLATACEVMIPAGVTRFDIEANIAMTTEREVREFIDFQIEVPEEYSDLLRGSVVERVAIEAHGNEIGFATDAVATLAEDNEMTGVEVSVSIDRPSPAPITLNVATSGTATVNEDYRINTTTLRIPANASSASLTLWGINNNRGEGSKSIVLTISGNLPEGWTITDDEHTVTLQDDDLSIFFTGATTSRVDEPGTGSNADVTVTVGITQAPTADITVRVAAGGTGETATPGSSMDYTFTGMDFTFPADSTAPQTATFSVHPDNVAEEDEFIVLTIADDTTTNSSREREGSGFSLGNPHTVTIPANDNTVALASDAVALAEGNGTTAEVTVNVNRPAPVDITLNVSAESTSTATEGTDYTISTPSLRIPAGRSSGMIRLTGRDDNMGEGNEFIDLRISVDGTLPPGWMLGTATHHVTLQDDDLSIFIASATPTEVAEPDNGDGDVTRMITVGITQAPTDNITVSLSADTTASSAASGDDFVFAATDVTFTPRGALTMTRNIKITDDDTPEEDETIVLTLADDALTNSSREREGSNFSLGGNYTITIPANDNTVAFASDASVLMEGNGTTADVTVSVNRPAPVDITLNVAVTGTTAPKAATEGMDYENLPDSLTIREGQSSGTITLRGRDDNDSEGNETIMLEISLPSGSSLPDGWAFGPQTTHTVTLRDDDVFLGFTKTEETVEEDPVAIKVMVRLSPTPVADVNLTITASSDAATAGSDYTFSDTSVSFASSDTGDDLTKTVTINVLDDNTIEETEAVVLTITDMGNSLKSNGNSLEITEATYTLTITDNDTTIRFTQVRPSDTIGENGAFAILGITATTNTGFSVDVEFTGTAQEEDYTVRFNSVRGGSYENGVLTVEANPPPVSLRVTSVDDTIAEPGGPETVIVTLKPNSSTPPELKIIEPSVTVKITDND